VSRWLHLMTGTENAQAVGRIASWFVAACDAYPSLYTPATAAALATLEQTEHEETQLELAAILRRSLGKLAAKWERGRARVQAPDAPIDQALWARYRAEELALNAVIHFLRLAEMRWQWDDAVLVEERASHAFGAVLLFGAFEEIAATGLLEKYEGHTAADILQRPGLVEPAITKASKKIEAALEPEEVPS